MGIHKKCSLVYPYFKFAAIYKKRTMCLFIHIISMYTHNLKFVAIEKNYLSFYSHNFYVYPYFNYKKELCE